MLRNEPFYLREVYFLPVLGSVERGGSTLPGDKIDRKSTRLNSNHGYISYAVFCLKKKKKKNNSKISNKRQTTKYNPKLNKIMFDNSLHSDVATATETRKLDRYRQEAR